MEAPATSKEYPDVEITNSTQYLIDISEKAPNNDVNITIRKNENPSAGRIEPSEPSEPSANLNGNEDESNSVEGPSKGILKNAHDAPHRNTNNDVSKKIDNNFLPAYVYRLGHSDTFACKYCKIRDDKWGMIKHYHPEVEMTGSE